MKPADALPRRSDWFFRGFRKYARRFIAKNFHALRIDRDGLPTEPSAGPAVVAMNHASWWDPMVAVVLSGAFSPRRVHYAPIDEKGLAQYPILERLGLFGVELDSPRGGMAFLRRATAILGRPTSMLWITPQGRFQDPRDRPVQFKEGLGRLLARSPRTAVATLAVEYPFWNDRRPEALIRFGPWIEADPGAAVEAGAWTSRIEAALEESQDALAVAARSREPDRFTTLVDGSAGVGGVYELGRRLRAAARREAFTREHQVTRRPPDLQPRP